ncbi:DUF5692 family protein [Clostridium oceanicum]|uniref:DUF5692 family protein n=1 Tax=Clostridium oceanicum TaxID=1543 RepID=A0ABN1J9K0_9CLOT
MGILYEGANFNIVAIWFFILFALMAFNEFGRSSKWGGIVLFLIVPIILTIFVWPTTAAPGNEYGTGNWFNWVKTYSALAGCLGFMAIRYIPSLAKKKWALCFPAFILAFNILEAAIRDFQCFGYGAWNGAYIDNLWVISGPWNIMNGIAGLLNIILICGWFGIFVSKDKTKDMIWPDMIWIYVLAYDLWNFAYTYNCIADHSVYCGLALLLSCTIPTFFIKKGAWLQHRAQTLALWIMFVMTVPTFADRIAPVPTTHNPTAFFIVSLLALIANVVAAVYQINIIMKRKLNPLKNEVYVNTKAYKKVIEENKSLKDEVHVNINI